MSSNLPVDILPMILKNLDKADLATMCRVNKVCRSFSQDILYRDLFFFHNNPHLICRTLAHSTHLARRVRSFSVSFYSRMESNRVDNLTTALRNMSSLRMLALYLDDRNPHILDGCTFKLDSFSSNLYCDEYLIKFLNIQPSLTCFGLTDLSSDERHTIHDRSTAFGATHLPNLTRVTAHVAWLRHLIPGRPVSDVNVSGYPVVDSDFVDWNFFTLSTAPIRKLTMKQDFLYDKPVEFLASLFPSLVHLRVIMTPGYDYVRRPFF
jgi:hypothetical protein